LPKQRPGKEESYLTLNVLVFSLVECPYSDPLFPDDSGELEPGFTRCRRQTMAGLVGAM